MSVSCAYEGTIRHRRFDAPAREFSYPLFMVLLDLAELPELFDGRLLWSARRPAVAWFRRGDHLGDPRTPLADAARDLVEARTGRRPEGPVRLLTHLRYFGIGFNPVSFLYCMDAAGERTEAVIAEVTNTPWGERHSYVLERTSDAPVLRATMGKRLHVSPFLSMEHAYEWRMTEPAETASVHIAARHGERTAFDATLALQRRELTPATGRRLLARHPAMTARVLAGIYGQALRLKLRGARVHPHPARAGA